MVQQSAHLTHQHLSQQARLSPRRLKTFPFFSDQVMFFTSIIIVAFGLIMIYSTTAVVADEKFKDAFYFVKRQGASVIVGLIMLVAISYLNVQKLKKISHYLFPISILLLALVLIPGLGLKGGGAMRWIGMGPIRFQPAELVKVLMVFFIAGYVAKNDQKLLEFKYSIVMPLIYIALISIPLLLQPDFGSAAVISLTTIIMIFACGGSLLFIAGGATLIASVAGLLVMLSPYRLKRVLGFLDPYQDHSGQGYQLIQSLIAVGNGGLTGVGLGESQQKLFFLPAAHNDFIFAVVAEELGFIGCLALLSFFLIFLWRGVKLCRKFIDDTYFYAVGIGLTTLIVLPALLNVGVTLGLLPTKGLTLPLVSYGGSSVIVSLMSVGLLLALSRSHQRSNR